MLDLSLVERRVVDEISAGGVEDFLFKDRVKRQRITGLLDDLRTLAPSRGRRVAVEQLLDFPMVLLQHRYGVLFLGAAFLGFNGAVLRFACVVRRSLGCA